MKCTSPSFSDRTRTEVEMRVVERMDIRSSEAPFSIASGHKVGYPDTVKAALGILYARYNAAFNPLVRANREWQHDYRHAVGCDGTSINFCIQVDMTGLTEEFLHEAAGMPEDAVCDVMRQNIFEIENSIAMYQLLERFFEENGESRFRTGWRAALNDLRHQFGKPIALLAVTKQKHEAMLSSEFGLGVGESPSNAEILDLSGFDAFFGPEEFKRHLASNGGESEYLLFVRSSDPVSKLRNPEEEAEDSILNDQKIRQVIKRNAITFNVDDPAWPVGDIRRINDTKWYMPSLGIACPLGIDAELNSHEVHAYLSSTLEVGSERMLRFKPAQGAYGCYGHRRGSLFDRKLRGELRRELRRRGPYMVQPELDPPTAVDENGREYTYIDRVFFAYISNKPTFIGGFRSFMPLNSKEAKFGRNHGNKDTVWAEIV